MVRSDKYAESFRVNFLDEFGRRTAAVLHGTHAHHNC